MSPITHPDLKSAVEAHEAALTQYVQLKVSLPKLLKERRKQAFIASGLRPNKSVVKDRATGVRYLVREVQVNPTTGEFRVRGLEEIRSNPHHWPHSKYPGFSWRNRWLEAGTWEVSNG